MKVLILAAGRGTRISRYLSGNPKCTVDIGEEKLIQYTIDLLHEKGIKDIALVLGYKPDVIKETLKGRDVKYYYNPFYDITNSIASAWFAKDFFIGDDLMIMNGDVFLEPAIIDQILEAKKCPVLFSDEGRKEEADYKFYYENGLLKKYGKELEGEDITGEYIGIAKMSKQFISTFVNQLEKMIEKQQHFVWWENVLYELTQEMDIYVEDVDGKFWAEVDYIEDYERILKYRNYILDFNISVRK